MPRRVSVPTLLAASFTAAAALAAPVSPSGWIEVKISEDKRPTVYREVREHGHAVVHAVAEASASGLGRKADFDLKDRPLLSWRWKVSRLIPGADNAVGNREDSPARVILAFDGDVEKLPLRDRTVIRMSEKLSGRKLPYATLMYVWANRAPVDTVIENPHTRRVQMIVVSSGEAGVGRWQTVARDVVADYKHAFGTEPGRLLAYGVMTDTDNTGETAEAWYADLKFRAR